jgi:hypothetical protein
MGQAPRGKEQRFSGPQPSGQPRIVAGALADAHPAKAAGILLGPAAFPSDAVWRRLDFQTRSNREEVLCCGGERPYYALPCRLANRVFQRK